jgi:hypothetical protein
MHPVWPAVRDGVKHGPHRRQVRWSAISVKESSQPAHHRPSRSSAIYAASTKLTAHIERPLRRQVRYRGVRNALRRCFQAYNPVTGREARAVRPAWSPEGARSQLQPRRRRVPEPGGQGSRSPMPRCAHRDCPSLRPEPPDRVLALASHDAGGLVSRLQCCRRAHERARRDRRGARGVAAGSASCACEPCAADERPDPYQAQLAWTPLGEVSLQRVGMFGAPTAATLRPVASLLESKTGTLGRLLPGSGRQRTALLASGEAQSLLAYPGGLFLSVRWLPAALGRIPRRRHGRGATSERRSPRESSRRPVPPPASAGPLPSRGYSG